jgi:hypothetical protein
MKANMGTADRVIRLIVAAILAVLIGMKVVEGTLAIILGIVAAVFLLTSIMSFCPAYLPLGLSTRKGGKEE